MAEKPACSLELLEKIDQHAQSSMEAEIGGILIGRIVDGRTTVSEAMPALKAVGHRANVTFTHEVWEDVLKLVDEEFPDDRIIGWYHSHPGFGIFLSDYDKFIHQNFFSDESAVALVVDPHTREQGWFGWVDGSVELLEKSETASKTRPKTAPEDGDKREPQSTAAKSSTSLMAALVLAVAGFGAGYALRSSEPRVPPPIEAEAPAQSPASFADDSVETLQKEIEVLKAQLAEREAQGRGKQPFSWTYRVRPGDSLWTLAELLYGSGSRASEIARANRMEDPSQLEVGQRLKIPLRGESR